MRRDWNLIRLLLLQVEGEEVDLSDYSERQVDYHRYLLTDSPLVIGAHTLVTSDDIPIAWITGLTARGHDFLSWARNDARWSEVRRIIATRGMPETLDNLCALAEAGRS
jgi:hypothetical protein